MPGVELIGIGVGVIIVLLILLIVMARTLRVARPDEALIITGRSGGRPSRVVIGSRAFVVPIRNKGYTISLASRSVKVNVEGISRNGIKLFMEGVAQVKIGGDEQNVRLAAQRFLHQQDQIETYTQDILAGSLRAVVGTLSVEQIVHERAALAQSVQEVALDSLNNQGLIIDTLQISSVEDDSGYLQNLGRPDSARVEKLADIAEAEARQESSEKNAIADEGIAVAEQQLDLRRAQLKEETDARQAAANAAGPLAEAEQREHIVQREEQVAIRQAELKEKQLDTEVRRPADAARYRSEQEAAAELARRQADAEAHKADGLAEAATIAASGQAEAESIAAKAEAYAKFNQAAIVDRLADVLPKVAHELSQPYANIDDLTVISTDGASKLSQSVANNMNETVTLVERMTGVDLRQLVGAVPQQSPSSDSGGVVSGEASETESDDDEEGESAGPSDEDGPGGSGSSGSSGGSGGPPVKPAGPSPSDAGASARPSGSGSSAPAPAAPSKPPEPTPPSRPAPRSPRSGSSLPEPPSGRSRPDRGPSSGRPGPTRPQPPRSAPTPPPPPERQQPPTPPGPRPDRPAPREAQGRPDGPDRPDRPAGPGRPDRPGRPVGPDGPGRSDGPGGPDGPGGRGRPQPPRPDRPVLPTFGEPPSQERPQFPPPFPPPSGPPAGRRGSDDEDDR